MFAALADLTVDPCAQIVGNYLRGNGLNKCRESFQGVHLLSAVRGMEKGRRNSIAQKPVSRNFDAIPALPALPGPERWAAAMHRAAATPLPPTAAA